MQPTRASANVYGRADWLDDSIYDYSLGTRKLLAAVGTGKIVRARDDRLKC
jgi:hypothetical protein